MTNTLTSGTHHIGLTVSDLEASAGFFTGLLGWQEVRRDPGYPAIFVSDGKIMVTLWALKETYAANIFNKDRNVGLHHVAFTVDSEQTLDRIYQTLSAAENVRIEFAPELLRDGPMKHMMCFEPSGIRVEFIWPGN